MKNSLLFGNGINLLDKKTHSWNELLKKLVLGSRELSTELPYTLNYEKIFMENCVDLNKQHLHQEINLKNKVADILSEQGETEYYRELVALGFDNYMTTNYDDALLKTTELKPAKSSNEEIYSIRRKFEGNNKSFWKLHGCIKKPKTIMLGLDHYCGSVSKLDAYIKGKYRYTLNQKEQAVEKMEDKIKHNRYDQFSWIDCFFNSNLHIVGLSLDYTEIDLWWLLNKRARLMVEKDIKNKIYYHDSNINKEKKLLLESMNVKVVERKRNEDDYLSVYKKTISDIQKIMAEDKGLAA